MLFHIFQNLQSEPMARKERLSKGRTMMPNYFVFCEGDTEVAYIEMLRSFYRLPIHIIAKKTLAEYYAVSCRKMQECICPDKK